MNELMKRMAKWVSVLSLICLLFTANFLIAQTNVPQTVNLAEGTFSYSLYAKLLHTYVNDTARVNYARLKQHQGELNRVVEQFSNLSPTEYQSWSEKEKLAFWINAYNVLTLKAIIDHYPIKAGFFNSLRFPKNSIRQIDGVWTKLTFSVMGKPYTLNTIEHKILRPQFKEPRVHMSIVCASIGCPPLRNEPFMASKLNQQLDDQSRKFLSQKANFSINRQAQQVILSSIFDWFKEDFVPRYGGAANVIQGDGLSNAEKAVLTFVSQYIAKEDAAFLKQGRYKINYSSYDWGLNEQ